MPALPKVTECGARESKVTLSQRDDLSTKGSEKGIEPDLSLSAE